MSNKGIKINADVNGSYQILMKVFPEGEEGVALHPTGTRWGKCKVPSFSNITLMVRFGIVMEIGFGD